MAETTATTSERPSAPDEITDAELESITGGTACCGKCEDTCQL